MMRIAVAGGTGLIGTLVVDAVRTGGDEPVVLARSTGVDLTTGAGLGKALVGSDAVIDVTNVLATSRRKSLAFFEPATRNLLAAAKTARIKHHLLLSIVGVDRVPFGYYIAKRRQEELCLASPVPTTILRATQFHQFAAQLLERGGPLAVVPKMRSQPVAAGEVAAELVRLAHVQPQGYAPEIAGPEVLDMPDMVRRLLQKRGVHKRVLALRLPGAAGKAMVDGGLLPQADGPRGSQSYEQWLRDQPR